MVKPSKKTVTRTRRAARMLVRGATWRQVAGCLGYRDEHTARKRLVYERAELWWQEYDAARALYADEIEAEADVTQRELMRHQYVKRDPNGEPVLDEEGNTVLVDVAPNVRQSAANSIKSHAAKLRAQKLEPGRGDKALADLYALAEQAGLLEGDPTDGEEAVQSE